MNKARIAELRAELDAERISYGELAEIEAAFADIPDNELRDARENALAADMLDELEAHAGPATETPCASMNAHTPAPWELDRTKTCAVVYDEGREIIIADCDQNGLPESRKEANARLVIKAPIAPKLAEALRAALPVLEQGEDTPMQIRAKLAIKVRAALAEWDKQ